MEHPDFTPQATTRPTSSPESPPALPMPGGEEGSVLGKVKRRRRVQGRARAPRWMIFVAAIPGHIRYFCLHTLPPWLATHKQQVTTVAVSLVVHLLVAGLLALWALPSESTQAFFDMIVTRSSDDLEDSAPLEIEEILQPELLKDLSVNSNLKQMLSDLDTGDASKAMDDILDRDLLMELEPTDAEMETIFKQGEFGGRSTAGKAAALKKYGGTADSERAVFLGLTWLQSIQQEDGSWNFQDQGLDARKGSLQRTEVGATSLALLCFLGSGHTHATEGPFQKTVEKGLAYIGSQADVSQGMADLRGNYEGISGMYVQGLATICISEAYALDRDNKDLKRLTTMAVKFIEKAQNSSDGGWRYSTSPNDRDTSVSGWQIMALQSAKAGRIPISSSATRLSRFFLKDAQADSSGAYYCYDPDKSKTRSKVMTAVGLLCQMYMGWDRDHEGLKQGVEFLAAAGPDRNNIYHNYYATQVLRHFGGDPWKKWNQQMRELLVSTQITDGPAAGSWRVTDPHGGSGGQIYQTTLSILTLEVYYRHLPIYRKLESAAEDETD